MKKTLLLFLFNTIVCIGYGQTANNFPLAAFQQVPSYSVNTGYYGDSSHFNNDSLSSIIKNLGGKNLRVSMPDYIVSQFNGGFGSDMTMYASKGFTNMTAFLGSVWDPNRLNVTFPGCSQNSFVWINEYDSIYHFNGTINMSNKFAYYVYLAVHNYKNYVKIWEIVNEPLLCSSNANVNPANANYWSTHIPRAQDLPNLLAPLPYYIRLLRIAWTVIKTEDPTAHVTTGGLISVNDIKVLNTYTDNPGSADTSHAGTGTAGSVTTAFPLAGGAYYDVLDEHIYYQFSSSTYANNCNYYGNYNGNEYSDFCMSIFKQQVNGFDSVSTAFGYDGTTFPKKGKMLTEIDAPNTNAYGFWGSDSLALDSHIKLLSKAQQYGFFNIYTYALGDYQPTTAYFSNMGDCNDLTRAGLTVANVGKKRKYYANLTFSNFLYNKYFYDAASTIALSLPSNLDGTAMKDASNNKVLILWAKSTTGKIEFATGSYTLTGSYIRREYNYVQTGISTLVSGTVTLNSTPSLFFSSSQIPAAPQVNAGNDTTINLGSTATLKGTANVTVTYSWSDSTGKVIGTTQSINITPAKIGKYTYTLTVTDSLGNKSSDSVVVSVQDYIIQTILLYKSGVYKSQ